MTGRPAPGRQLQSAIESQLVNLLRGVAAEAAEAAYTGWQTHPSGSALLTPALARPAPDLPERAERLIRDWQRGVLDLVRAEAGDKRFVARTAAYAVNAMGLAVMVAVFASTAFIPTGLEVAAAGGTTVAAQKVLEAIFGDQAIRTLADRARRDLLVLVDRLLDEELARYLEQLAAVEVGAEPGARLRAAGAGGRTGPRPHRTHHRRPDRPGGGAVSNLTGKVRDALRGGRLIDADRLLNRLEAVDRFRRAVDGLLPEQPLGAAHTLVERAEARLALSRDHTVVALAGATGSGKSSLFNALARFEMSPVGVRRPTTGVTHACVWGPLAGASQLLDWVGVLPRHRFVRESALDGDDELALHGLVLLDLPDFDSVQRAHRSEVDRLLGLVDLVVWVVDPQKYADRVVHANYLRDFRRHQDVTVVVLNQADRLPPAEVPRVVDDLRRLLAADQLDQVPVLASSSLNQVGIADLRAILERAVSERQAALSRLSADVDVVVDELAELVGPPAGENDIDRRTIRRLTDALAGSAGVPAVAEATRQAYVHRAAGATGWPVVRGWRRLRPDPLRRLHLPGPGRDDAARDGHRPNPPRSR